MSYTVPLLVLASATFYSVSMIAMKYWGQHGASVSIVAVVILALVLAVGTEVQILREERLGMVYVAILGTEVIIIAVASLWLFGETFSVREIAGAGLILAGTALAWA